MTTEIIIKKLEALKFVREDYSEVIDCAIEAIKKQDSDDKKTIRRKLCDVAAEILKIAKESEALNVKSNG